MKQKKRPEGNDKKNETKNNHRLDKYILFFLFLSCDEKKRKENVATQETSLPSASA